MGLLPRLRRLCLALKGNRDAADDLMQGAVERALARAEQFQPGTRLDLWLFRIARNLHLDELRAIKARGGNHDELDAAADHIGADGVRIVEARSDLGVAALAFAALPQAQRETFVVVVLDGLTYREAAELFEVPVGTIMSRLARARAAMEQNIRGATGDDI